MSRNPFYVFGRIKTYFKCAIMKERNYLTFRRSRKSLQNTHRQDGDLKVFILNPMLFKIVNWKIYSVRHINLFTDTSLIDNNLCIQSFRAFYIVIRQKLANMLDTRGFQSVQYHCHVTCLHQWNLFKMMSLFRNDMICYIPFSYNLSKYSLVYVMFASCLYSLNSHVSPTPLSWNSLQINMLQWKLTFPHSGIFPSSKFPTNFQPLLQP